MKLVKALFILVLGGACFKATAQHCNTGYLGTKTLYKAPATAKADVPKGYHAVFINHLNRHGARHLTKDVNTSYAWSLLKKADSLQMLTNEGKQLWQMVVNLNKVEKGNVKNISAEGRNELFGLGERMYDNYLEVLRKPIHLNVAITKEVRTKQSLEAFIKGLKSKLKDSVIITERTDDTNLRFYDLSPAYTKFEDNGPWVTHYDSLKKALNIQELQQRIASNWLKPSFLQDLKVAQTDKLVSDVFGFENIIYSVADEAKGIGLMPADIDISKFFTCAELDKLGELDAADGYYKKGPGLDNDGIQVRIAAPLLAEFIKTVDSYLTNHHYNAELRFGHAETVSPFATIMGIDIAGRHAKNAAEIHSKWKPGEIIMLSSNIDWVLYSNNKEGYLVKFLLNEKPVKINGINPETGFYYNWKTARDFYLKKLSAYGVALNGNMNDYLSDIK